MDRVEDMRLLVLAAEHGSLAAAARELGLSPAAVTRRLQALEAALGVRLLDRTTRRLSLTEAGETYRAGAVDVLARIEEMERDAAVSQARPRGTLRVLARRSFAFLQVAPRLARFTAAHPDLRVELTLTEQPDTAVAGTVDVLIRPNAPEEKSLAAMRLASSRRVLCAAPGYLERAGVPHTPANLAAHACLAYRYAEEQPRWCLRADGEVVELEVRGVLVSNSGEALRHAALGGAGIALLPSWMVAGDLSAGALCPCLPCHEAYPVGFDTHVYAVYRRGPVILAKVQAFVDFLLAEFATEPWFDG